ncbi:hypothetical protein N2W54_001032 [Lotmaria passim]
MSVTPHDSTTRFERITAYVDLASEEQLLPTISVCAARLAPECVLVTQSDIVAHSSPPSAQTNTHNGESSAVSRAATSVGLIRLWQAEEADVFTRDVNNKVPFMNAAELLITDKNTADGAVTYALYRRQMPVLSLAHTHLPARTSLHQLLYTEAAAPTAEAQKEAVERFLSFPAKRGQYTTATTASTKEGANVVVVVNADGYPVQLPQAPSGTPTTTLPPPPTLFASVLAELCSSHSEHLDVLRRRNPILPGVLAAFHRYQNRGVLRAMLHRGLRVEVAPETATASLAWVRKFVALMESDEGAAAAAKMATAEAILAKFESHWLELPLAQKGD